MDAARGGVCQRIRVSSNQFQNDMSVLFSTCDVCGDLDNDGFIGLVDYGIWFKCYQAFVGEAAVIHVG